MRAFSLHYLVCGYENLCKLHFAMNSRLFIIHQNLKLSKVMLLEINFKFHFLVGYLIMLRDIKGDEYTSATTQRLHILISQPLHQQYSTQFRIISNESKGLQLAVCI